MESVATVTANLFFVFIFHSVHASAYAFVLTYNIKH